MAGIISREELVKLANMSRLIISEEEIPYYTQQLEARLSYTIRLKTIIDQHPEILTEQPARMNIMRDDVAAQTNSEPFLAQAPQREENFFVVPVVVKQNK